MIFLIQIISLLIISGTLILGAIVLFHGPRRRVNKTFAVIVFSSAFWVFSNLMVDISETNSWVKIWSQLTILGPIIIPAFFLYFSYIFPKPSRPKKHQLLLIFSPLILLVFVPTHYNIEEAYIVIGGIPGVVPGVLYVPFFAYFGIYIAIGIYKFFKNLKNSTPAEKTQIKYVIFGTILAVSIGLISNVLLLSFGIPEASRFGPLGTIFWTSLMGLAILKHRLFDIKVIATEFFTALLLLLLFINIFFFNNISELVLNIIIFIGSVVFGIFLIRSVLNEVRQREKMETMAEQLAEANIKLKKLDKAKSEFISIASHQLRTPLTAISGYLSMVLEGTYGTIADKVKRPISNVFKASRQLNQLVNTLLSVSRIEAGKIKLEAKKMSLEDLIEPIVEEFKIVAHKKGLYLKLSLPPLSPIPIDQAKMNQVIMNIIDNAIKYTEKGGITITVNQKRSDLSENIVIRIEDTGLGMNKEQLDDVFEKFERGTAGETSWAQGAGLGLFIAKKFVELHKGKVWAESPGPGKGSSFYIELPVK